jgi:DNA-binding Lrp family transcriptional regulator
MSYRKQELNIPTDWEIKRNEFYDIDPFDNSSTDDKDVLILVQEDILWIKKKNYNLDLGWYGGDDLENKWTGFYICLYRGDNWNKCDLLEKYRAKNKKDVVEQLHRLITAVDKGEYDNLVGHRIDEDDMTNHNSMTVFKTYSVEK